MRPALSTRTMGAVVALALAAPLGAARAANGNEALLAEIKKLAERMERLEARNRELEQRLAERPAADQRLRALEEANARMEQALQSERLSEKEPELVTRLKAVEFQTLNMQKQARQIEALEGITVSGSLTTVVQGVNGAGSDDGKRQSRANYRGDVAVSLPGGEMGNINGKIFAHVRLGQGNGIGLRPTYTSTPNSTAFQVQGFAEPDDSFGILAQAWYQLTVPLPRDVQQDKAREHLHLTFGKIDPFVFFDQNAAADDESVRFLNNAFVHNPLLDSGGDVGADRYGFSPGAIFAYVNEKSKPESWMASVGVFGSERGANFSGSLAQPFVIAQLETSRRLFGGLAGNYRAYFWRNGRGGEFDGRMGTHTGFGFSADQRVGDAVTLFARYGQQIDGKVRFDRALTIGSEIGGSYWGRSADSVGVALGALRTSDDFRRASLTVDADGDGAPDWGYRASGSERIAEVYYRFRVTNRFDLTPDFQLIQHPGGDRSASLVKVAGLRARVGF